MDFIDIFDELLNDNLTPEVEGTNETLEGLWFENGLKNALSENIFWTTIGDPIEDRYPVAQLGTIIEIPISKYVTSIHFQPHEVTLNPEQIVLSSKNAALNIEPSAFNTNANGRYYTKEPPIAFVPRDTAQGSEYQDSVTRNVIIQDTGKSFNTTIATWNSSHGAFNPAETVYNMTPNARWDGAPSKINDGFSITDYWAHSRAVYSVGNGLAFADSTIRGDTCYIKCVAYRDDVNEVIEIAPLLSGFIIAQDAYTNDTYNIQCIDKDYVISRIPYTVLNNENYFDPEKDGADERPSEDEPEFDNDNSKPDGGGGNYINYPSDDIGLPPLPTVGAIDTGFLTMYNPSTGALQSLVDYLWTSDWVDTIKKMVSNPMDAIISLQLAPYNIDTMISSQCKIGAINTDIVMNKVTNQYQILNCGTVKVPEHWGNALDYNNVNVSIYIPFCGIRSIDTNVIMNSTVGLAYYIDLLTGSAIAMLIIQKKGTSQSVYYTFDCNLNYQIPITGANYSETIKALLSVGASAVGAGMAARTGNASAALGASASMVGSAFMAGSGAHHYESSGNLSANTGLLGQYQAYIIIELPKQSLPANFKKNKGYTSNITSRLGDLRGYTEVAYCHLDGIVCTDAERDEINNLLKSGVIL